MSLTSLLRQEDSDLASWLSGTFPRVAAIQRAYRAAVPVRRVHRPTAPVRAAVRLDVLGTAVDQRLRCAFTSSPNLSAVADGVARAASLLPDPVSSRLGVVGRELLDEYAEIVAECQPDRRRQRWLLDERHEEYLDRVCCAMAWFEEVYRDGYLVAGTPVGEADESLTLNGLLSAVPRYMVDDLRVQVVLAEQALADLRDSTQAQECAAGTSLAGSGLVGGADVDLIVRNLLVDIKSTSRPERLGAKEFYQLAGYLLLDTTDEYAIDSVGFYLSRIGWKISWPVGEFLRLLGAAAPLPRLRGRLTELLAGRFGDASRGRA